MIESFEPCLDERDDGVHLIRESIRQLAAHADGHRILRSTEELGDDARDAGSPDVARRLRSPL